MSKHGYHKTKIKKGQVGKLSKIFEEVNELKDAKKQKSKIMVLHELSDILGAIDLYLKKDYKNKIKLKDLIKMNKITQRAFKNGYR
jgi:phosphoribosyl-ATP pyrophosphohydrolase